MKKSLKTELLSRVSSVTKDLTDLRKDIGHVSQMALSEWSLEKLTMAMEELDSLQNFLLEQEEDVEPGGDHPYVYFPKSTNIEKTQYDPEKQLLKVFFKNGGVYRYGAVPPSVNESLEKSDSVGVFFSKNIRNSYPYEKLY